MYQIRISIYEDIDGNGSFEETKHSVEIGWN
jgi:hypothetical protein